MPSFNNALALALPLLATALPNSGLLVRRDDINTHPQVSDKHIKWCDAKPWEVIKDPIRKACPGGDSKGLVCDPTVQKVAVTCVDDAGDQTETDHLQITVRGNYDGPHRDHFLDALSATFSKGYTKTEDKWAHGVGITGIVDGKVDDYNTFHWASITRDTEGASENMQVKVLFEDDHPDTGLCASFSLGAGIASAINGVAGGFFTAANAICTLAGGS